MRSRMFRLNSYANAVAALLLLAGCSAPPPRRVEQPPPPDAAKEAWYPEAVAQLAKLNREAEDSWKHGRSDDAAAAITKGQPIQARLLSARQPTLPALEAASDLDDLYGRMLLANGREGWARLFFQKNVTRWKMWKPATADTARRLRQAQEGIAACDRRLK
jgi:hypothetical protein